MQLKSLVGIALIAAFHFCPDASAQTTLPTSPNPVFVDSSSALNIDDCSAGELSLALINPEALTSVSCEYDWLRANIVDGKLVLDYDANTNSGQRACRVTLTRTGYTSSVLTVYQPGDSFSADLSALNPADEMVIPSSGKASSAHSGYDISKSFDNDYSTYYHSNWNSGGFVTTDESAWPILEYFFDEPFDLGYIIYVPVGYNGGTNVNGRFGVVDIYTSTDGGENYSLVNTYDFDMSNAIRTITIPEEFALGVNAVKFRVHSGKNNVNSAKSFASCIEMQFYKVNEQKSAADDDLFVDDVYSALKDDVTLNDINNIKNPMLKTLAEKMYTGQYDSKGRVSHIAPLLSTSELNSQVRGYGQYDQYQGATGVMLGKGTYTIFVSGITDAKGSATLTVRGWKTTSDSSESFTLKNGINIINKTTDWNGLCYINNYNTKANLEAGNTATINVHIVNGAVNGVLHPWLSNDENQALIDNACHGMIDLVGSHVHAIWETDAVKQYSAGKYVQYMNLLDQYIIWIQRMMGIEKYNLCPYGNVSLIYGVNWNYMTQVGTGIAINVSNRSRVCGPDAMMNTDSDAVWGLSHEWGHQHQMDPYFRWSGTWEVTNNECSIYNFLRMGYYTRVENSLKSGINVFLNDTHTVTSSTSRQTAVDAATSGTAFDWCPALKEFAASETNVVTKFADDKYHALSAFEANGGYYMMIFWMLQNYFGEPMADGYRNDGDFIEDFEADLYQSIRTTPDTEGSTVGKSSIDKYELIAHAQAGSSAKFARLQEEYPESCWITQGYLNGSNSKAQNLVPFVLNYIRKASFLSGYNLVPYFERWGLLRTIAMYVGDYTSSYYLMPADMYQEFCDDMAKMTDRYGNTLKDVDDEFIEKISNSPIPHFQKPEIPNDHQITIDEVKSILSE